MTETELRPFLMEQLLPRLQLLGIEPSTLQDEHDLYASGILDSLGLIILIQAVEKKFGESILLDDVSPDEVFTVGGLLKYAVTV